MEIKRETLLSSIKAVLPATAREEVFEQANKVAFVDGKVVAFNDNVAILHPLPGDLDIRGALDGRQLCALLDKLSTEVVTLAVDGNKLKLSAGRPRATFDLLPVSLPFDTADVSGEAIELPKTFSDKLRWVRSSCSKDANRPVLTCVLVENGWMQSSDSYRASRVRYEGDLPRLMLPIAQVKVLLDYPVTRVCAPEGATWARFETDGGVVLSARTVSGEFPDLSGHYEIEGPEVKLAAALSEAIGRAQVFAKRKEEIDEEVSVSMRPNQVTVSAQCEGGSFSEVVRCDGAADGAQFSIHPKFLTAALRSGTRCVLGPRSVKFSGEDWEHVVALKASR